MSINIYSKEVQDLITQVIDSGGWKHSWHIKTTDSGYIDLHNKEVLKKLREIANEKIIYSRNLVSKALDVLNIVGELEEEVNNNILGTLKECLMWNPDDTKGDLIGYIKDAQEVLYNEEKKQ